MSKDAKSKFLPALLRHSPHIRKMAQKKSKVSGIKLERDRNKLQEKIFEMDRIFKDLKKEEDPVEREKLLLYFQVLSIYTLGLSNVHLSDYLCVQWHDPEVKRKNAKTGKMEKVGGTIRASIGETFMSYAPDLLEGFTDEDDKYAGLFGRIDKITNMINDIGNHHKAFRDETGMPDREKYVEDRAPRITAETATEDDFEARGITEEETAKAEEGITDVPDLRRKEDPGITTEEMVKAAVKQRKKEDNRGKDS